MHFKNLKHTKSSTNVIYITIKIVEKNEKLLFNIKYFKNINSKQSKSFKFNRNLKSYNQFLQ